MCVGGWVCVDRGGHPVVTRAHGDTHGGDTRAAGARFLDAQCPQCVWLVAVCERNNQVHCSISICVSFTSLAIHGRYG